MLESATPVHEELSEEESSAELSFEALEGAMSPRRVPTSSEPKPLLSSSSVFGDSMDMGAEKGAESGDRSERVKEASGDESRLRGASCACFFLLKGHMFFYLVAEANRRVTYSST